MSGASALAAAKRRRSKVDSNRATSSTSNNNTTNTTSRNSSTSNMPPRLNVQQSFQYMWQKILQVESMVNNNTTNIKSSSSNSNSNSNNNFEINGLRQKISALENSMKQISTNTSTSNSVEINGEKFVSVEQFNEVMSKVATDMQGITEKVAQLSEYVSNVQNNNVVLRNILDSMESQNFGFDGSNSVGLSVESNDNSSMNEESVEEVVQDVVDIEQAEEEEENSGDTENDNSVSATPDVSSVLEKLKTLNSDDIKEEVAAELNNNITLVVEENSNNSPSESTN